MHERRMRRHSRRYDRPNAPLLLGEWTGNEMEELEEDALRVATRQALTPLLAWTRMCWYFAGPARRCRATVEILDNRYREPDRAYIQVWEYIHDDPAEPATHIYQYSTLTVPCLFCPAFVEQPYGQFLRFDTFNWWHDGLFVGWISDWAAPSFNRYGVVHQCVHGVPLDPEDFITGLK